MAGSQVSGRALEAAVDALHGLVCGALQDELTRAMRFSAGIPEGDPEFPAGVPPTPINPQLIDKVLKFLANNGVSAPRATPKVDALAATLKDLDLDAEAARLN